MDRTAPVFPFWIVTQRRGIVSVPVTPDDAPGYIAAFTTAENAARFMVKRGDAGWENRLVARATFPEVAADLRAVGVKGICLDPCPDKCGTSIDFDEIG